MLRVRVETEPDLDGLGARWRALEARSDASFFQGWGWTGCLLAERFPRPLLVSAERDGCEVALALFNACAEPPWRGGGERLCLGESGDGRDSPFIEHNGVLLDRREGAAAEAACLEAALRRPGRRRRRLVLGGVGADTLLAAGAVPGARLRERAVRMAPFVDLDALRRAGRPFLASLSANTRAQLRQSRRHAEREGSLALRRAGSVAEARGFLDELARLHQATWTGRGRPGAFADPWFRRFHAALLERVPPGGGEAEVELLRVTASGRVLGLLYNLRRAGRVLSYQGGFDYAGEGTRHRPGLVCHHAAIELHLAGDALCYDLLGGSGRYKRSLAAAEAPLHWAELHERASLPAVRARGAALLDGVRRVARRGAPATRGT